MLFQNTWKYVTSGQKTQTRRLAHEGDIAVFDEAASNRPIIKVIRTSDAGVPKTLYEVGQIHSVQPGIAKKTVGNIRITAIRRERLQDLGESDVLQEMPVIAPDSSLIDVQYARQAFIETWNRLYIIPGSRWEDNPEVWVLEFESALKSGSLNPKEG